MFEVSLELQKDAVEMRKVYANTVRERLLKIRRSLRWKRI